MDEAKVTYVPVPFSAPGILVSIVASVSAKRAQEAAERASGRSVSLGAGQGCLHAPSVNPISVRLRDSAPVCKYDLLQILGATCISPGEVLST